MKIRYERCQARQTAVKHRTILKRSTSAASAQESPPEPARRMALHCGNFAFISPLAVESKDPSLALSIILMSNKDYYHQGQPQQQYYPPQGATFFTRCFFRSCVIDMSVCHKGHRLVKATTLNSRSSRTSRVMVVSLAISRSRSLKQFMCTPNDPTRSVRTPTHAEVYHIVSSPRNRRTVAFARRV